MKTTTKVIEKVIADGCIRKYAVWLKLRSHYKNGVFYNYNPNKLHKITGFSRVSINKYVDFFIKYGWCTMHSGNLCFIGFERFKKLCDVRQQTTVNIEGNSVTEIVDNLRYEILKNKNRNLLFLKEITKDLIYPEGKDALERHKKAKRFFKTRKKTPTRLIETKDLTISLQKIGNLIGTSPATAHALIKSKVVQGVAKVIKTPFKKSKGVNCLLPGNMFYSKGYVYTPVCNKYVF